MLDKKIKVCIIDDDKNYRESLKAILKHEQNIIISNEYTSGTEALKALEYNFNPDVCLIDIMMDGLSGLDIGRFIKDKNPDIHIIIMTAYPDQETMNDAAELQADYIEKGTRLETIIDKIIVHARSKNQEQIISLNKSNRHLFNYLQLIERLDEVQKKINTLSKTQKKVMHYRSQGLKIEDIAIEMGIDEGTVKTHINRAMKKLDIPNLLEYITFM